MRIAILGGAGFIGTNLVYYLTNKGHQVFVMDNLSMGNQLEKIDIKVNLVEGDVSKPKELLNFLQKTKPARLYHLAANSDIKNSSISSELDLQNTFLTSSSLAICTKDYYLPELVFASSSAVYGDRKEVFSETSSKSPISAYGWMKLASESLLEQIANSGQIGKLLIARFPNVTGKWQTHGVIYDLIQKLIQNPHELYVLGNGTQNKPYVLASELVDVMEQLIAVVSKRVSWVNISSSSSTTVHRIVEIITEVSKCRPKVTYGETSGGWIGDVPNYQLNIDLLKRLLPNFKFSSSDIAVRNAASWLWGFENAS